uniref:5-beta-cholestane-3-alpha,7-alpha-diol 12-alpha-hydroxylase n=1 Tax=Lygus hesperus TaxID=30085 RepID=A0A0A9WFH5_LYGHE
MSKALIIALRVEAASQGDRTYQGLSLWGAETVNDRSQDVLNSDNLHPIFQPTSNLYQVQQRGMNPVQLQPARQWSPRPNPQVACWRCDGLGHYCHDCPTWSTNKQQSSAFQETTGSQTNWAKFGSPPSAQ